MNPAHTLELALDTYHQILRAEGHTIYRIPDPVHVTARRGQDVTGRLLAARACDFGGWTAQGRPVMLDAKHCEGESFDLGRLDGVQIETLTRCAAAGGIAGVVVWIGGGGWWLPVDAQGVAGVTGRTWRPGDGSARKLKGVRWMEVVT